MRPVGKDEWALGVVSLGGLIPERELLRADGEKLSPLCLSFSPDDRRIMVANSDGMIRSYDAANGREVASYPILAAAFSPDGSRVVSLGMPVGLSSFGQPREATQRPQSLRHLDRPGTAGYHEFARTGSTDQPHR